MPVRKPIAAGQFYAGDRKGLMRQIEECFKSGLGPGKLPKIPGVKRTLSVKRVGSSSESAGPNNREVVAVLVPHAGYFFSGAAAAHSYYEIASAEKPDVFVIMGPNHSGYSTSTSTDDWETPLGIARNDIAFAKALDIEVNPSAQRMEHSIEVQLPFLQYIYGKDFSFVPICVTESSSIADRIANAARETGKSVTLVVSSDMTHYGIGYGYLPFREDVRVNMEKLDGGALDLIRKMDVAGFGRYLDETGATICGAAPITVMMEYCRKAGATTVKLLKYYTSGDITNDYDTSVGYASLVVLE